MSPLLLLQRIDRSYALVTVGLGLVAAVGTAGLGVILGAEDRTLRLLMFGMAIFVLALTVGMAGLLLITGARIAQGGWRLPQTVLGVLALASNPPLGTAFGLYSLWVCWSHPGARARLAGEPAPPADPAADDRARRYFRLARLVILGSGLVYMLLTAATLVGVGALLSYGARDTQVVVTADAVELDGMYGVRIDRADLESVELRESLPTITRRTNGYAAGSTLKGWFQTNEYGRVRLNLHTDQGPWLYLFTTEGLTIYGSADPERTRAAHRQLGGR